MSNVTQDAGNGASHARGAGQGDLPARHPPRQAIDPVCGMAVDPATAPFAERRGQRFYFCSEGCRTKFLSQQAPALPPVDAHASGGGHPQGSPAPSTVRKPPGASASYTCPMHP